MAPGETLVYAEHSGTIA